MDDSFDGVVVDCTSIFPPRKVLSGLSSSVNVTEEIVRTYVGAFVGEENG